MSLPDPRELASHGDVSRNFRGILDRFEGEQPVEHVLVVSGNQIIAAIVPIARYQGLIEAHEPAPKPAVQAPAPVAAAAG